MPGAGIFTLDNSDLNRGNLGTRVSHPGCEAMSASDHRSHVVLVVDDEILIRSNAAEALRDCGCTTYEAAEADEAMQVLEEHPDISVLFTDINMPGRRDGIALAGAVNDRRPDVHLILTSGRERPAPASIPDDWQFIAKPYDLGVVTGIVAALPRKD